MKKKTMTRVWDYIWNHLFTGTIIQKRLTALGLLFFVCLFYWYYVNMQKVFVYTKFTAGTMENTRWSLKSGKQTYYTFVANNKVYRGGEDTDKYPDIAGKRFLVIYDSLEPKNHIISLVNPIPESVPTPSNGWYILPFPLPDIKVNSLLLGICAQRKHQLDSLEN